MSAVPKPQAEPQAYLAVNNTTWTKSWTQRSKPKVTKGGKIDAPDGPEPGFPAPYNWINLGIGYVQRGGAYQCTEQWQLSGRRGWNNIVYGS